MPANNFLWLWQLPTNFKNTAGLISDLQVFLNWCDWKDWLLNCALVGLLNLSTYWNWTYYELNFVFRNGQYQRVNSAPNFMAERSLLSLETLYWDSNKLHLGDSCWCTHSMTFKSLRNNEMLWEVLYSKLKYGKFSHSYHDLIS